MIPIMESDSNMVYLSSNLIDKYRVILDELLVNIKRNTTRQLCDYKIFHLLQEIYNTVNEILITLSESTPEKDFMSLNNKLRGLLEKYLKYSFKEVHNDIYELIKKDVKSVLYMLNYINSVLTNSTRNIKEK